MKLLVYGGSFNPPHMGHVLALRAAVAQFCPERTLVIPDCEPPHKTLTEDSPEPWERLELVRRAFGEVEGVSVSDMELKRGGRSYTSDTVRELLQIYPGAQIILLIGTDMLTSFERWYDFQWLLQNVKLAVLTRQNGEEQVIERSAQTLRDKYGAQVERVRLEPTPAASTDIRQMLKNRGGCARLPANAYAYVISRRLYGAKPEFAWLRERAYSMLKPKRVEHVQGCEAEAIRLARRWGADEETAAEAGILHDITKKLELNEQLLLCEKYGIITDKVEAQSEKLLHAKTGAEVARDFFGVPDDIYGAIRWHTTGKPNMSLLEKVIYLADYIEPTRDFPGVDTLRTLAYENLDEALVLGFTMSLEDLKSYGEQPHENTIAALKWYDKR